MDRLDIPKQVNNPIVVRIGNRENEILADGVNEDVSLSKGALVGGDRYGFILIVDSKGKQNETVYPTQCPVRGVEQIKGALVVYEDNKKENWQFSNSGVLLNSADDKFTEEFTITYIEKEHDNPSAMARIQPAMINPLLISVEIDPTQSTVICVSKNGTDSIPVNPGVCFSGRHFGFILRINSAEGTKDVPYETQNQIESVGVETPTDKFSDICVFESGKYHPWHIGFDGTIQQKAMYEPLSRKDVEFVQKAYGVASLDEAEIQYNIDVRKAK